MTKKLSRLLELARKAENDDGWNCLSLAEHDEYVSLEADLEKMENFYNEKIEILKNLDLYVPDDNNYTSVRESGFDN